MSQFWSNKCDGNLRALLIIMHAVLIIMYSMDWTLHILHGPGNFIKSDIQAQNISRKKNSYCPYIQCHSCRIRSINANFCFGSNAFTAIQKATYAWKKIKTTPTFLVGLTGEPLLWLLFDAEFMRKECVVRFFVLFLRAHISHLTCRRRMMYHVLNAWNSLVALSWKAFAQLCAAHKRNRSGEVSQFLRVCVYVSVCAYVWFELLHFYVWWCSAMYAVRVRVCVANPIVKWTLQRIRSRTRCLDVSVSLSVRLSMLAIPIWAFPRFAYAWYASCIFHIRNTLAFAFAFGPFRTGSTTFVPHKDTQIPTLWCGSVGQIFMNAMCCARLVDQDIWSRTEHWC